MLETKSGEDGGNAYVASSVRSEKPRLDKLCLYKKKTKNSRKKLKRKPVRRE